MNLQEKTLTLRSEEHYGKRIPPQAFGEILRTIPGLLRRSVRMSFEGRSTAPGKSPQWLKAASDVRFVGHNGEDETVLYFETPTLGEAAAELYEQSEFWPSRPAPEDTPFDLLADVVEDVRARRSDSARFDRQLLWRLRNLNRGLNGTFQSFLISGRRYPADRPAVVDKTVVDNAAALTCATPKSRQVRVAGVLDMIRASTNTVAVKLDTGEEIRGVLIQGHAKELRDLIEKKVTLMGKAVFRPSGNLLRVDIAEVRAMRSEDLFFTHVPKPRSERINDTVIVDQKRKKGVAAIIGRWPGDESDEEIERVLQEMS